MRRTVALGSIVAFALALAPTCLAAPVQAGREQSAGPDLITLHVHAGDSEPDRAMDLDAKGRADSAEDLRRALEGRVSGRELWRQVDERERDRVDVVIEVVGRDQQSTRRARTPGNLGSVRLEPMQGTQRRVLLRLTVPAADHADELEGLGSRSWREAADEAAEAVEGWIRTNLEAIRAARRRVTP